jgi:hypothetical protein
VTLSTTTSGAAIRYTTDGSTPTSTSGTVYSGPVTVSATTTLKAIAYVSGVGSSPVTSAAYTIVGPAAPSWVSQNVVNGDYATAVTTSLSMTGGNWLFITPVWGCYTGQTISSVTVDGTPVTTHYGQWDWGGSQPRCGDVYYVYVAATSTPSVVVTWSSAPNGNAVETDQYAGIAASNPLDVLVSGNNSAGKAVLCSSIATTAANDLLIEYISTDSDVTSQGLGTTRGWWIKDYNATSAGTYQFVDVQDASTYYSCIGAAFKAAAVAAPTFSVASGTYTSTQSVTLATTTSGATIRYTTDGSTPTSTSGTVYSGAVTISATATLKAIAYESGLGDSGVASAAYTITGAGGTVATPAFSVAAGTYTSTQSVMLSTTTSGATIRYTTDGSTPTSTSGTVYSTAVAISSTTTLKAIAYASGWTDSAVASATYTITGTVAAPAFGVAAGTYTSAQSVTLSTTTSGAAIRYTTDGSTPTSTSGTVYSGAVSILETTTLKAIAYESGWTDSVVASATYTITGTVAAPAFSVAAGTYTSAQSVTLSTTTSGAAIRYTTDGSTPTSTSGTVYSGAVTISATTTLKAIAYESGWTDSAVASAAYTITGTVAAPVFSPGSGNYASAQSVTIASATAGATIRYTTDGSTPTAASGTVYSGAISVSSTTTLKAIAYADGMTDSGIGTATYSFNPVISSLSATSAAVGRLVTITGGGFGPSQGTSAVTFGGISAGVASRWGETSIAVLVPSSAVTGNIVVTVGGVASPGVLFTVLSPPVLGSVSPSTASVGEQVTITGSGFGAAQGSGLVWLGTANGNVQSWSDQQIIATVAPEAVSGKVQVLQNGLWSDSAAFGVARPAITQISPTSGDVGSTVAIAGSGFGSAQGTGAVWLGGSEATITTWSDTEITVTVEPSAHNGVVFVQQGGIRSNGKDFTLNSATETLVPDMLTMFVGQERTLQARNTAGQLATGLSWTSSDPDVVSLSSDAPPKLQAVAPGRATITAGTATADVIVEAETADGPPLGTVLWSVQGNVSRIVPAVPGPAGVSDVFAFDDDAQTVRAITADGEVAWTADLSDCQNAPWYDSPVQPDFRGGLVGLVVPESPGVPQFRSTAQKDTTGRLRVRRRGASARVSPRDDAAMPSIVTFDGITGQRTTVYQGDVDSFAVHPDGTIFTVASEPGRFSVIGIDPATGAQKFSVPVEDPAQTFQLGYLPLVVAGDGYAYFLSYAMTSANDLPGTDIDPNAKVIMRLLRVDSSGASESTVLKQWPYWLTDAPEEQDNFRSDVWLEAMITNADQGIMFTWKLYYNPGLQTDATHQTFLAGTYMAVTTGINANVVNLGLDPQWFIPRMQREDGSFVGDELDPDINTWSMVAVDQSGSVLWRIPNERARVALEGGGVLGESGAIYDLGGAAVGMMASGGLQSFLGYRYRIGSIHSVIDKAIHLANSFCGDWLWCHKQPQYAQLPSCSDPSITPAPPCPAPKEAVFNAWWALKQRVADPARAFALDSFVFNDSTGTARTRFSAYLSRQVAPEFYDGTQSNVSLGDAQCAGGVSGRWMRDEFAINSCRETAATCHQGAANPLRVFFEPRAVGLDNVGVTDANVALLFHEALHGYRGGPDPDLQAYLGCTSGYDDTRDITIYLQQFVSAQPLSTTPLTCTYVETHRMPSSVNVCLR